MFNVGTTEAHGEIIAGVECSGCMRTTALLDVEFVDSTQDFSLVGGFDCWEQAVGFARQYSIKMQYDPPVRIVAHELRPSESRPIQFRRRVTDRCRHGVVVDAKCPGCDSHARSSAIALAGITLALALLLFLAMTQ